MWAQGSRLMAQAVPVRRYVEVLAEQDAGAADLLRAQSPEEHRDHLVHELEVRRQRRRVLLGVVEDLFARGLGVQRRAGTTVNEDELRSDRESLPLHIQALRHHGAASEIVVLLDVASHESGG